MTQDQQDRIVLVVDQARFDGILLDAGIGHRNTYCGSPAFVGTVNQYGRLIVAAAEVLGSVDALLLATVTRHIETGEIGSVFYFPGLELS